mmetsp:Transcript_65780/g.175200  ORF Transcript_65780/g.175200 Transcript_65780/m.175200 type:complete len:210 (+) Transcript_65780:449-1078(+)
MLAPAGDVRPIRLLSRLRRSLLHCLLRQQLRCWRWLRRQEGVGSTGTSRGGVEVRVPGRAPPQQQPVQHVVLLPAPRRLLKLFHQLVELHEAFLVQRLLLIEPCIPLGALDLELLEEGGHPAQLPDEPVLVCRERAVHQALLHLVPDGVNGGLVDVKVRNGWVPRLHLLHAPRLEAGGLHRLLEALVAGIGHGAVAGPQARTQHPGVTA